MIYDISREGAVELRHLGDSLKIMIADVNEQMNRLQNGVENERCNIGIYYGFVMAHIADMSRVISKYEPHIDEIIHNLYDKAAQIDAIVCDISSDTYNAYINHEIRRLVNHSTVVKTVRNNAVNSKGEKKGYYEGDVFFFDDEYVPHNQFNPEGKDIKTIRKELHDKYGIALAGIPIADGEADFSSIAVASVTYSQIMKNATGKSLDDLEKAMDECRLDSTVDSDGMMNNPVEMRLSAMKDAFGKNDNGDTPRNRNFAIADSIVAEMQLDIPGLNKPYSKEDVERWRKENHFSWDEQLDNGYILVPSVIHAEIQHRGLVGYSNSAADEYKREQEYRRTHDDELYWVEDDAPISIEELKRSGK